MSYLYSHYVTHDISYLKTWLPKTQQIVQIQCGFLHYELVKFLDVSKWWFYWIKTFPKSLLNVYAVLLWFCDVLVGLCYWSIRPTSAMLYMGFSIVLKIVCTEKTTHFGFLPRILAKLYLYITSLVCDVLCCHLLARLGSLGGKHSRGIYFSWKTTKNAKYGGGGNIQLRFCEIYHSFFSCFLFCTRRDRSLVTKYTLVIFTTHFCGKLKSCLTHC